MGKIIEATKLEDIDSPRHKEKYEVLIGTRKNTSSDNYKKLCDYLNQFGEVKLIEKEEPNGIPFKNSNPFIIMEMYPEHERRLKEVYENNPHKTPLKHVTTIYRMKDDVQLY